MGHFTQEPPLDLFQLMGEYVQTKIHYQQSIQVQVHQAQLLPVLKLLPITVLPVLLLQFHIAAQGIITVLLQIGVLHRQVEA